MLLCNALLPRLSDDFDMLMLYREHGAYEAAKTMYMDWNGRFGNLLSSLIAVPIWPAFVFDAANSLVGTALALGFFALIFGRLPKDSIDAACLALFCGLTILRCAFGSDFVWETGALNYSWGYLLIVASLLPYRFFWGAHFGQNALNIDSNAKSAALLLALPIICLMAGWSSEQMGAVTIATHAAFFAYAAYKRVRLPAWYYLGAVAFLAGWLALYLSPGHAKRAALDVFQGTYMSIGEILSLGAADFILRVFKALALKSSLYNVFVLVVGAFIYVYFVRLPSARYKQILWALGLVAFLVLMRASSVGSVISKFIILAFFVFLAFKDCAKNGLKNLCDSAYFWAATLFLLYFLCALSLIQMLDIPHRAKYGSDMLLLGILMLLGNNFYAYLCEKNLEKWPLRSFWAACILGCVYVAAAFIDYRYKWQSMLAFVESQKAQGIGDIVLDAKYFRSFYRFMGDWGNPGDDPAEWPNTSYAKMFGVNSVEVKK